MNCKITLRSGDEFKYEPLDDLKMFYVREINPGPELIVSGFYPKGSKEDLSRSSGLVFDKFTFDHTKTNADPIKIEFY